jgi:hypothetical protein
MTVETPARLTPESRAQLRNTVRGLRESLVRDLRTSVDQTYLLQLPALKASPRLSADRRERRRRLEEALAQRAQEDGGSNEARERALMDAVKETGATLLNRLVLIRHMEAMGLSKPAVVTGGWKSPGYVEFRGYAGALCEDDTQGYGAILQLVFDELAQALPGLFGDVGFTKLIPVPPETLRALVEALDGVPAEAWRDDMTLGWVYQYWNDPDREALDAKLNEGGKVEHNEIASKTQMFTERYLVEWLLQNSLGPTWLAMCRKNGWKADVDTKGVLSSLDTRRAEWRKKRDANQVAPDMLMPINGPLEGAWKYYVPQPLTEETVKHAPESLRKMKLLDPACGSGHFLVVAFDLLVDLYREEARHRGASWSDRHIAQWILEDNLHGVDIDPRAVQIAAAAVFLKAKALARDAKPSQVHLVAPALRLSSLSKDDPALLRLEEDILAETGIPSELTRQIIEVLEGVDYLGTLLKVGDAVDKAIEAHQGTFNSVSAQSDLFVASAPSSTPVTKSDAKKVVLSRLNSFLATHAGEEDLGLRLRGLQLAAGVRFASIVKEGQFDVVVGNPPYQGTSKMKDAGYVAKHYPKGKSDLYAAFLERGLELCRPGGSSALVTMRNWMFLSGFSSLREHLLKTHDLRILGDVDRGAFEEVPDEVVATTMSVFRKAAPSSEPSVALQPTPLQDKSRDGNRTARKRSALLVQEGRFEFARRDLAAIPLQPLIYWWDPVFRQIYKASKKLGEVAPVKKGMTTSDNGRFVRFHWELESQYRATREGRWQPYILGAKGKAWFEPLSHLINWSSNGLEVKVYNEHLYGSFSRSIQNERYFFKEGVAFTTAGADFAARAHRAPSIIDSMGSSIYFGDIPYVTCLLNTTRVRQILQSLNPTIHFKNVDVDRVPLLEIPDYRHVYQTLASCFAEHESHRETSTEFREPGPSTWDYASTWASTAIDRDAASGAALPVFSPSTQQPSDLDLLSFQMGVSGGRFRPLDPSRSPGSEHGHAPSERILFLSPNNRSRALDNVADVWSRLAKAPAPTLNDWLRSDFFEYHRKLYENRPTFFPLASQKRSFLAFVCIHTWNDSTLSALLADHLIPERKGLEGALVDLQADRTSTDKKARSNAEKLYVQHKKWLEELEEFIAQVRQCAEKGPPPPDDKTPHRNVDTPYRMDLNDGVMVNSAALWPLLDPLWKDPKKWWKELAAAKGRKDYDWSHLAARYFPDRVEEKCKKDPSLAVAHGCFWKYHPEKAYQWELRLQDEIRPEFRIDEASSNELRGGFLGKSAVQAHELEASERARRDRKSKKQDQDELGLADPDVSDAGAEAEDLSA